MSRLNYYLRRAEHTGEILLPAASHMPLSLRFLKQKKACVTKRDKNAKQKNKQQSLSTKYNIPGVGPPGADSEGSRQLSEKPNEPGSHVPQPPVCRLQRR